MTSTIHAEETTLPELLQQLHAGDTVIITSGDKKIPVAKIEAIPMGPINPKRFGFLKHLNLDIPDSFFFDPLPEDELRLWNEGGPDDPPHTHGNRP